MAQYPDTASLTNSDVQHKPLDFVDLLCQKSPLLKVQKNEKNEVGTLAQYAN